MITVLLYGHLRKAFGKYHRFEVRSPAEAVKALSANFKNFQRHVIAHNEPGYHVMVGREARDEKTLRDPADDVIRIVPAVAGAKNGWGQTILGIVLIVVGVVMNVYGGTGTPVMQAGIALLIGGVVQLLSLSPKKKSNDGDRLESYGFDGAENTTAQGNPVPLCYGEGIVGSQVISIGLTTESL